MGTEMNISEGTAGLNEKWKRPLHVILTTRVQQPCPEDYYSQKAWLVEPSESGKCIRWMYNECTFTHHILCILNIFWSGLHTVMWWFTVKKERKRTMIVIRDIFSSLIEIILKHRHFFTEVLCDYNNIVNVCARLWSKVWYSSSLGLSIV